MHPSFFPVDHKIGPDIHHSGERRIFKRRAAPERLDLRPASPGWPPVPLQPAIMPHEMVTPKPSPPVFKPQLVIVPPPRPSLRDRIGRWLIRTGQRMILQNRPG